MNGKVNKLSNEYADLIPGKIYSSIPKAVWAAIAISFATGGGDRPEDAVRAIVCEWRTLADNGIVPQKPPAALDKFKELE